MLMHLKENIDNKQQMSEFFLPMLLVYMICTGMCGSGVLMTGMTIMKVRLLTAAFGWKMMKHNIISFCVAAPGTTFLITAVPRVASTTLGATSTTPILVFVLCVQVG